MSDATRIVSIGTRDSGLAVAQTRIVIEAIRRAHPHIECRMVTMKTTGDRILDQPLDRVGGKGLFVKELDEALLDGRVDLCVHSYKDMPTPCHPSLPVVAVPARGDPRDVLVLPRGNASPVPDHGLPLGTSSLRRRLQLAALFPGWTASPVRGNVHTRLRKLDEGQYGGLVLAAAGLRRLGLWERAARAFSVEEMIPAPCQGTLAIQGREGEDYGYLAAVHDRAAWSASLAERAFVEELDGGCSAPTAAYAEISGGTLRLAGMHADEAGVMARGIDEGPVAEAESVGRRLARRLRKRF